MVRSTPTGISVLVDPLGRAQPSEEIGLGQKGVLDITLPNRINLPVFSVFRGAIWVVMALFSLLLVAFDTFVKRIKKNLLPG